MKKHESKLFLAIIISESSHIFCCVMPTLFSVVSLLSGFGLIVTIPGWMQSFHDFMHGAELPVLMFSAFVVCLGWSLHFYSKKYDCHDTGCHHEPCGPRKKAASRILIAATILLAVNASVYFGIHRHQDEIRYHTGEVHSEHDHHDH